MKISELTDSDMGKVAEVRPDYMAEHWPEHRPTRMAAYRPEYMAVRLPEMGEIPAEADIEELFE